MRKNLNISYYIQLYNNEKYIAQPDIGISNYGRESFAKIQPGMRQIPVMEEAAEKDDVPDIPYHPELS